MFLQSFFCNSIEIVHNFFNIQCDHGIETFPESAWKQNSSLSNAGDIFHPQQS